MFSSLELFSFPRPSSHRLRAAVGRRRGQPLDAVGAVDGTATPTRLLRYLPLVLLTTASVVVAPTALVAALVPRGGPLLIVASTASAVAISVAIASAEAALWTRRPGSRDLLFADLMLWGWLRRCWAERRLAQAHALYDSTRKAGLRVSIELLEDLSKRLEARDAYTHGHNQRVARHAERIARAMRLPPAEIAKIRTAATVHDVGKIYTPREILNNPGQLTEREYAIVKLHASDGADMLAPVGAPEITAMVRHHHERVDGHGYPDGLAGSEIPLGARIIAVADTFDAITSNRPYRPVGTHRKALSILARQAGSQLDGPAVTAFLNRYSARRSIAWFALAAALPQRILAILQTASPGIGVSAGAATSLLPALGTVGLLGLSPGLRHDTAIQASAHRHPAATPLHQPAVSSTRPAVGTRGPARSTPGIRKAPPGHRRTRGAVDGTVRPLERTSPTPLEQPAPKSPPTSAPNTPTIAATDAHEPVAAPTAPSTTSTLPPTPPAPPSTPPTPPVPPVEEVPSPPTLVHIPPGTLPTLPPVPLPGLSISTTKT